MKSKLLKTASYIALGTLLSLNAFAGTSPQDIGEPISQIEQEQMQDTTKDVEAQSIDLFNRLDTDQNGIVSEAEFSSIGSTETFKQVDIDTNGQISQLEMFRSMQIQHDG